MFQLHKEISESTLVILYRKRGCFGVFQCQKVYRKGWILSGVSCEYEMGLDYEVVHREVSA